jgi:uncharacterized protein (DUF427 family)
MAKGHTITTTPATAHVVVTLGGEKIAETDRPVLLDETGLPTRYYLPREDVRTDLLRATDLHTTCPFKGEASYWSAEVGGQVFNDLVWSYETPIPEAAQIAGLMCFYPDRVELTVDGQQASRARRSGWASDSSPAGRCGHRRPASSAPGARRGVRAARPR